jgi:predicted metal-binding membrane protein
MALRAPFRHLARIDRPAGTTTLVLTVSVVAWVGVVAGHTSTPAHHGHPATATTTTAVVLSLVGWTLMVLAMMLPPALPLVALLGGLLAGPGRAARQVGALSAFAAVWVGVGAVLVSGAAVVRVALADVSTATTVRLAGGVVLLAGLYQFTPVKNACLTACRTPRWFALRLWGRRGPSRDAVAIGSAYGASCVGCCWALMLLCLGTGALALPVMVALAVVMAAERLLPGGRLVARTTGVAVALVGLALVAGLLPSALVHPLLGA